MSDLKQLREVLNENEGNYVAIPVDVYVALIACAEALRQCAGEDWHHHDGCAFKADETEECDCPPGAARNALAALEAAP